MDTQQTRHGGFVISKIHQLSGRIFGSMLRARKIELNPAQGRILFTLWQHDDIAIQELAQRTALTKSTLTRMLDRLEESGHLVRISPREDRRKVFIQLTEHSESTKAAYQSVSDEMVRIFYRDFSAAEIDECERYLHRILTNLTRAERSRPITDKEAP